MLHESEQQVDTGACEPSLSRCASDVNQRAAARTQCEPGKGVKVAMAIDSMRWCDLLTGIPTNHFPVRVD